MKKRSEGVEVLLKSAVEGIHIKKGFDVLKIDLRRFENRIADFFVICHGTSVTQVDSICDSVEDTIRQSSGEKPLHTEGRENCFWVLLDYGNVVVHIFLEEYRNFYNLESLWADAAFEEMEDKTM